MRHESQLSQSSQPNLFLVALYPLSVLALLTLYACESNFWGFMLATVLIVVGVVIAISSMRRYRQRLNYVEV